MTILFLTLVMCGNILFNRRVKVKTWYRLYFHPNSIELLGTSVRIKLPQDKHKGWSFYHHATLKRKDSSGTYILFHEDWTFTLYKKGQKKQIGVAEMEYLVPEGRLIADSDANYLEVSEPKKVKYSRVTVHNDLRR